MLKTNSIFIILVKRILKITNYICENLCGINDHLIMNMKKSQKFLDTYYFNFNPFNNYLIIQKLIK